jgi:hypothetical protein
MRALASGRRPGVAGGMYKPNEEEGGRLGQWERAGSGGAYARGEGRPTAGLATGSLTLLLWGGGGERKPSFRSAIEELFDR